MSMPAAPPARATRRRSSPPTTPQRPRRRGRTPRPTHATVPEAARQIRLRNLAGPILLDLAGLTTKRREALAEPLSRALAADPLARLLGLGPLGLFEILRQPIPPPLYEVLGWPLAPLTQGL